jgi:hypothetical protein
MSTLDLQEAAMDAPRLLGSLYRQHQLEVAVHSGARAANYRIDWLPLLLGRCREPIPIPTEGPTLVRWRFHTRSGRTSPWQEAQVPVDYVALSCPHGSVIVSPHADRELLWIHPHWQRVPRARALARFLFNFQVLHAAAAGVGSSGWFVRRGGPTDGAELPPETLDADTLARVVEEADRTLLLRQIGGLLHADAATAGTRIRFRIAYPDLVLLRLRLLWDLQHHDAPDDRIAIPPVVSLSDHHIYLKPTGDRVLELRSSVLGDITRHVTHVVMPALLLSEGHRGYLMTSLLPSDRSVQTEEERHTYSWQAGPHTLTCPIPENLPQLADRQHIERVLLRAAATLACLPPPVADAERPRHAAVLEALLDTLDPILDGQCISLARWNYHMALLYAVAQHARYGPETALQSAGMDAADARALLYTLHAFWQTPPGRWHTVSEPLPKELLRLTRELAGAYRFVDSLSEAGLSLLPNDG